MKKYIAILLLAASFSGCQKAFFEPDPANDPEAIFEDLWGTFSSSYAPFEERGVDWQEQYDLYRPRVNPQTTEDELYQVLTSMLRSLNDGHVDLVTPDRKIFNSNVYFDQGKKDSLFNLDLIKEEYLQGAYTVDGDEGNTYGFIGNIGYWHLAWIHDNLCSTDRILDQFASADGLIIDLRNNGGGDMTFTFSEIGRLTSEPRLTHRSKTKNGPGKNDYTVWYDWNIYPKGEYFQKPLVLLTDRYTISAGERTTMCLKTLPNLVHMGDTTNGALSTKIGKELANGWYYSICPQKITFMDGLSYEGTGLIPDVIVRNTIEEIHANQDRTLEAALEYFVKK